MNHYITYVCHEFCISPITYATVMSIILNTSDITMLNDHDSLTERWHRVACSINCSSVVQTYWHFLLPPSGHNCLVGKRLILSRGDGDDDGTRLWETGALQRQRGSRCLTDDLDRRGAVSGLESTRGGITYLVSWNGERGVPLKPVTKKKENREKMVSKCWGGFLYL